MLIAQISDLHVGGEDVAARYRLDTRAALRTAIDQLNALPTRPDMCLVTGDLVDGGTLAQYGIAIRELERLEMPWYAVPGNHDERDAFREALAGTRTPAGDSEFIHYVIEGFPLRVVALDSIVPRQTVGELCEARLAWLDQALAERPRHPTILMMHHPPFATHQPMADRLTLMDRQSLAAVLRRHPQVEAIIAGHLHRAIHGRLAHAHASTCPSTAHQIALALAPDSPLAFTHEPPGFQLHVWNGPGTWTTHTVQCGRFAGPFPI